jgi:hypothetical protein
VLLALMNWGDRWYSGTAGPPARIRHLTCGHDTTAVSACAHCGDPLTVDNTAQLPGPGGRTGPGTRVLGPLLASRGPISQTRPPDKAGVRPGRPVAVARCDELA